MLKRKQDLNYRRGYASRHCSDCNHYVGAFTLVGIGGAELGVEPRCRVIGLEPGRQYRIAPASICDRFDNGESLRRIRGW